MFSDVALNRPPQLRSYGISQTIDMMHLQLLRYGVAVQLTSAIAPSTPPPPTAFHLRRRLWVATFLDFRD